MRYLGGKTKVSTDIAQIINDNLKGRTFVSLFCGSCAVESKIKAKNKILNDKHPYLIEMWKAVQNGYELPMGTITKETYNYIKEHLDEDKALSGFVGFGCSFGGMWFSSYASSRGDDYTGAARRSIYKRMFNNETTYTGLRHAYFFNDDYKNIVIPDHSVIYCDPPYKNTAGYSTGKFDHDEFWDYMRDLSQKEHLVYISEETAPDDFVPIWEKDKIRTLSKSDNKNNIKKEFLFVKKDK